MNRIRLDWMGKHILRPTKTTVEIDFATGGHVTRSGGYINQSDRSLRYLKCGVALRVSIISIGLVFYTQYSVLYESEEIIKYRLNLTLLKEHHKSGDEE